LLLASLRPTNNTTVDFKNAAHKFAFIKPFRFAAWLDSQFLLLLKLQQTTSDSISILFK
jgi:hypothetical protein